MSPTLSHYHRMQVYKARYAARQVGLRAELTTRQWSATLEAAKGACVYCGNGGIVQLDHFIPLCLGGHTLAENCIPACRTCNEYKARRDPLQQPPYWWRRFGRGREAVLQFVTERGGPIERATAIYHHRQGPCREGSFACEAERVTCAACRAALQQRAATHEAKVNTYLVQALKVTTDTPRARFLAQAMAKNGWSVEDVLRLRDSIGAR